MLDATAQAEEAISMMYLIYDYGYWTEKLNDVLITKREAGVRVRIMVDLLGTITDHPTNIFHNFSMLKRLENAGIEVIIFQLSSSRVSFSIVCILNFLLLTKRHSSSVDQIWGTTTLIGKTRICELMENSDKQGMTFMNSLLPIPRRG
jgi:phosphatidylserine/phosphatidylglycerophosphate/cardiolipin synthase-like enzyme